jgi:hypothetical protein
MTITIIQGLWKEGSKYIYIVKVFVATGLWKGGNKKKKFIVKVLVITWHSKILDCVLSLQAYLH